MWHSGTFFLSGKQNHKNIYLFLWVFSKLLESGIVVLHLPFLLQEDHLPVVPVKVFKVYALVVFLVKGPYVFPWNSTFKNYAQHWHFQKKKILIGVTGLPSNA